MRAHGFDGHAAVIDRSLKLFQLRGRDCRRHLFDCRALPPCGLGIVVVQAGKAGAGLKSLSGGPLSDTEGPFQSWVDNTFTLENGIKALGETAATEMPRYRCHKEVWALKIAAVEDPTKPGNESDGSRVLSFTEPYAPKRVDADYVRKHGPKAGGYFVVYKDGYLSFSPAEAFENGYTRL